MTFIVKKKLIVKRKKKIIMKKIQINILHQQKEKNCINKIIYLPFKDVYKHISMHLSELILFDWIN